MVRCPTEFDLERYLAQANRALANMLLEYTEEHPSVKKIKTDIQGAGEVLYTVLK